jgi:hypothetical protein
VAVAVVAGVGTVEVKKAVDSPAPPAKVAEDRHGGPTKAGTIQVAGLPKRTSSATQRAARTRTRPAPGAAPRPGAGSPAGQPDNAPGLRKRAGSRNPLQGVHPRNRPVSDPTPIPETPSPAPAPSAPAAPVTPPASAPVQPWQQQYTDSMRQAQLGLQIGGQVYQQAMQLTQKIVSGIFPLARQR